MHFGIFLEERRRGVSESATLRETIDLADTGEAQGLDGVWLGGNPLVVCDVAEHAFGRDYPRRADYVAKFLEHIDWEEVSRRYRAVDRM